jgi:imidazole glycerol phosphate synthase subunit HisF
MPRMVLFHTPPRSSGFTDSAPAARQKQAAKTYDAWSLRKMRRASSLPIIAAGGISSPSEVRALENIGRDAAGGTAVYKNRLC